MVNVASRSKNKHALKHAAWKRWIPCPILNTAMDTLSSSSDQISLENDWKLKYFDNLEEGFDLWQKVASTHNLFLSTDYLKLLQKLDLGSVTSALSIFCHEEHGCFGVVLQTFTFDAQDQLGKLDQSAASQTVWDNILNQSKQQLAKLLKFNVLTAGQLLLTGDHAIKSKPDLGEQALSDLLAEGLEAVAQRMPQRIHAIMLKDIELGQAPLSNKYSALPVQPNMVLDMREHWHSFDDYLADMGSKYRVRARRARKKRQTIERRELTVAELEQYQSQMHQLYKTIADQADFNSAVLPADYFLQWKQHFSSRFKVWGYFDETELIGFTSAVYNDKEFEAHYIGFNQAYNRTHQLYLNMLYDFVDEAILSRSEELVFSRTALAIKSSVGAVAQELHCWVKSRVRVLNPVLPMVAKFIAPPVVWEARHPFKAGV